MSNLPSWLNQDYSPQLEKALKADMTPMALDIQAKCAVFYSKEYGEYLTVLDHCPCVAFSMYGPPCKHIVRLALELNLIPNQDMQTDFSVVQENIYIDNLKKFVNFASHEEVIPFIDFLEDVYSNGQPKPAYTEYINDPKLAFLFDFTAQKLKWSKKGKFLRYTLIKAYDQRYGKEVRNKHF